MRPIRFRCPPRLAGLLLFCSLAAHAGSNSFCGGATAPGDPSDLANVVGDQTLEYAAQQPASIVTCAKGYLLEKCGDHETANKVFDKCIAAGYAGAMIWKALLLEDGAGVEPDLAQAARLMHRAATSGDPAYAPIGKLHYATMLQQGKGVPRDEAAARQWFEAAAAEGSEEAQTFLRTGYHTGERDRQTMGAGTPPPSALVHGLTGDNASLAAAPQSARSSDTSPRAGQAEAARKTHSDSSPSQIARLAQLALADEAAPPPSDTEKPGDITGQQLTAIAPAGAAAPSSGSLGMGLLLVLAFTAGMLRQSMRSPRNLLSRQDR